MAVGVGVVAVGKVRAVAPAAAAGVPVLPAATAQTAKSVLVAGVVRVTTAGRGKSEAITIPPVHCQMIGISVCMIG